VVGAQVPVLEGELKALINQKFEIKGVVHGGGDQGEAEVMSILVMVWFGAVHGALERDVADTEEHDRQAVGVMGRGVSEDGVELFGVQLGVDALVDWV
jgi:hypothetical protein